MENIKQNKVARLIQKELNSIFQKQSVNLFSGKLISVTCVKISPDLIDARIYISIFPTDKNEEIFDAVKDNSNLIKNYFAQKGRHQLRRIPRLNWFIDDTFEYAEKIDKLLK